MVRSQKYVPDILKYEWIGNDLIIYYANGNIEKQENLDAIGKELFEGYYKDAIKKSVLKSIQNNRLVHYKFEEENLNLFYSDGTIKTYGNIDEQENYEQLIQENMLKHIKQNVEEYEQKKVSNKRNSLIDILFLPTDLFISIAFGCMFPKLAIESIKETKQEKEIYHINKLYLDNLDLFENKVTLTNKAKKMVTTKVNPNNIRDFSYKSLKKIIGK